ncbi:MAG: FAD synthase [Candidatus Nanoarchaeia archaeon]|nr:FAD synthase [Candidatus Nanoarchaeia archaeon]
MTKVLVFGTYDIFHPGHEFFLKKAKSYGDKLIVVIARDSTVNKLKGEKPKNSEKKRHSKIKLLSYVDKVYLGYKRDKYKIIEKIKPDIICLGYDQSSFNKNLKKILKERGLSPKIIKIKESYKPHKYKSSILRALL